MRAWSGGVAGLRGSARIEMTAAADLLRDIMTSGRRDAGSTDTRM
jgi:hypothetical protein